ncbi:protease pro-enzyme activation domain-containing protein [Kitasatospora sp. MAP5-34]|uniref:protease pro-enzyme activation domain-containing protein n=1 Tax=Kitasatospora sp. MAP5-34 TaxID=3035102 RepID=UPI002475B199|nr:protease pro-enzyme activation domain-containing protein [Kitasatospora sp. MAP5-34]MDH6576744.1 subtilase family serine protease [Kitasatospora sp. MAP5-34]
MRPRSLAVAAALTVLPLALTSLGATAQAASISNASSARVTLPSTVTPAVAASQKQGDVPAQQQIPVAVGLKLRNTAELDRFLAAVSDPASDQYGKYLTPAQFKARYAPAQADVEKVKAFLRSQGLTVTGVSDNGQVIDAHGTADQIAKAFGTHESTYVDPKQNRTFFANDAAASLPLAIADLVEGLSGLNDHTVRHSRIVKPDNAAPQAAPRGLGPAQYDGAYRFDKTGADGAGSTVALWEFDGYKSSNLTTYDKQFGLSGPAVSTVSVDGANYDAAPTDGQGEVELDSEIVRGVAPKAKQLVYEAPNTDAGEIDMAAKIVADNKASVISISWGSCEPDTTAATMTAVSNNLKQAAAQGISVFSASGDDGSRDCTQSTSGAKVKAVDYPASDPYVTGVGGTNLKVSAANGYASESAWSTSGGGVSTQFAKPKWQTGTGVTGTMRTVPDISSDADPKSGFAIYSQDPKKAPTWMVFGGTSAAAPLWSGYAALFNQKAKAAHQANLGEVNPKVYRLANSAAYRTAFHDVTTGANQDFATKAGYDQVTGWGSPIADTLTTALLGSTTPPPSGGITNGGFETGNLTGWKSTGSTAVNAAAKHGGKYGAQVGSTSPSATSSLSQTFTAPKGSTKLSFAYDVTCDANVAADWATATLKDNTTGATTTVLPRTCTSGAGWQTATGSLTAGHAYTLTLTNVDDNFEVYPTYTYFDDVTVS